MNNLEKSNSHNQNHRSEATQLYEQVDEASQSNFEMLAPRDQNVSYSLWLSNVGTSHSIFGKEKKGDYHTPHHAVINM